MVDLTGAVFDKLRVISMAEKKHGHRLWNCICECGNPKKVRGSFLVGGNVRSCGCGTRELLRAGSTKHGHCSRRTNTSEYRTWLQMHDRCRNPNNKGAKDYLHRGIRVCGRWDSFAAFYTDMGPRPSKRHTLDRKDNDGNYEPSNCRWVTWDIQGNNKRKTTRKLSPDDVRTIRTKYKDRDETHWGLAAMARQYGVSKKTIWNVATGIRYTEIQ